MISKESLKVGQIFYKASWAPKNAFTRKKIEMVDAGGNTWYRYDKEIWEYEIEEFEIVGYIDVLTHGKVNISLLPPKEYFVVSDGIEDSFYEYELEEDRSPSFEFYSLSREVAEALGKEICNEKNNK